MEETPAPAITAVLRSGHGALAPLPAALRAARFRHTPGGEPPATPAHTTVSAFSPDASAETVLPPSAR